MITKTKTTLYQTIKQECEKKNRPLKIITDWDECLMPREPFTHYLFYKKITNKNITFEQFFERFWENAKVVYKGHKTEVVDSGITEIEEIRKNDPDKCLNEAKYFARNDLNFYSNAPFLSLSQDLLDSLKEGYIKEIIFTTTWAKTPAKLEMFASDLEEEGDPRKRRKFENSFGKFPQCKLEINIPWEKDQNGEFIEVSRADWIKRSHPDFDIFIDDNLNTMKKVKENHGIDKIYILPNTTANSLESCTIVLVEISSLKDEDFAYQLNQQEEISQKLGVEQTTQIQVLPKQN